MKIVIDIPEEEYKECKNRYNAIYKDGYLNYDLNTALVLYVANGTPLPQKEEQLIGELLKMPSMVISTAYLYATNYIKYGEDVVKTWMTAVQQSSILEKAYRQGYCDAMKEYEKQESEEITSDNINLEFLESMNIINPYKLKEYFNDNNSKNEK